VAGSDRHPLEVGLVLPHWTELPRGSGYWWATGTPSPLPNWSSLVALARQAEAAGFDSLWTVDQLLLRMDALDAQFGSESPTPGTPGPSVGMWECWSVLAGLAAVTECVAIGSMVTCSSYRNPALLARIVATVDDISGGRVIFGIGAGAMEEGHYSHGMRWDHRVSRFAEAIEIIHSLLRRGRVDFTGEYYRIVNGELLPRPTRPGPPIPIGAQEHGPRMLDLAARYANVWTAWIGAGRSHPDRVPPLRDAVDAACWTAGRDPATLRRSVTIGVAVAGRTIAASKPLTGTAAQIADGLRGFHREGIDLVNIWLNPMTSEGIEHMAEVLHRPHDACDGEPRGKATDGPADLPDEGA
jgi:alkanesulfonate monooxygenase SsuD/methylene tetrahydromethanopterin reductase-like flavin-dependent oxidoreductase (luciferase family)